MKNKVFKGGVEMKLVLLLEIKGNIAVVYDSESKKEFNVTLEDEQVAYYSDMLQENSDTEVTVFYDSTNKTLNFISHDKEIG